MQEQGREVSLRDHLSRNPTVEEIQSLVGVFPEATTIGLGDNNLGRWSVNHIAALAGIFPQATTINLFRNNLGAWSVDQIAALRGVFPRATKINLADNNLGTWSTGHIAALVGVFPQAITISLRCNALDHWSVDHIAALRDVFPQATTVMLGWNGLGKWSVDHIAALRGVFPQATTIDLENINLGAWSVEHIAALAGVFPQATTINLKKNNLGTWTIEHIAALKDVFPRAITIELCGNDLDDDLCGAIINLYEQNKFMILAVEGLDGRFQPQIDTMVMDRRGKIRDEINHIRYLFIKHSNYVAPLVGEHILKIILSFCFNLGPPSIADIINYNNSCLDENKRLAQAAETDDASLVQPAQPVANDGRVHNHAATAGQGLFQNQQPEAVTAELTGEDNDAASITQPLLDNRGQQETSSQWCCC